MFLGLSDMAINRQVAFILESANQCRKEKVGCLAIPRAAIIKLAYTLAEDGRDENDSDDEFDYLPSTIDIARGILPSLQYVIEEEVTKSGVKTDWKTEKTDSQINSLNRSNMIDPYGSDFFCIICKAELCNLYYNCKGCEKLLDKEYNVCFRCYKDKKYLSDRDMGFDTEVNKSESDNKRITIRCHTSKEKTKCGANKCKRTECLTCKKCWECSCLCHRDFELHKRFYTEQNLMSVLNKCKKISKGEETMYAKETRLRLKYGDKMVKGKETILDKNGKTVKLPSRYYPSTSNGFTPRRKKDIV